MALKVSREHLTCVSLPLASFYSSRTIENTATANSGETVDAPPRRDRLSDLCSRSFLCVPAPAGIAEQHPFRICFLKFLIDSIVATGNWDSHFFKNISKLLSIVSSSGVALSRSGPVSPLARKIKPNSFESCCVFGNPFERVLTTRWHAW